MNLTLPIGASLVAYAILKYRFIDIRIFLSQIFGIIFLVLSFVLIFVASTQDFLVKIIAYIAILLITSLLMYSVNSEAKKLKENEDLAMSLEKASKEIIKKNKRLEALLKIKSEFLDIASHQLRTPVSVINGTLSLFVDGTFDKMSADRKKECIDNAFQKGKKLNNIINDILSASDMDEGGFDLSGAMEEVDLSEVMDKLLNYYKLEIEQKNLILASQVDPEIKIIGNQQYLEQAIGNLIDNAIKYTNSGGNLEISLTKQNDKAVIKIKDSGIGIPAKEQGKLFQKFVRGSNAKELYTDGSGLGLFIVKKIIDSHQGGKVRLESKENQGTAFYIELKLNKATT